MISISKYVLIFSLLNFWFLSSSTILLACRLSSPLVLVPLCFLFRTNSCFLCSETIDGKWAKHLSAWRRKNIFQFQFPLLLSISKKITMNMMSYIHELIIIISLLMTITACSTDSEPANPLPSSFLNSLIVSVANPPRASPPLVDHPTQLICIWIFICYVNKKKDIAGQSAIWSPVPNRCWLGDWLLAWRCPTSCY